MRVAGDIVHAIDGTSCAGLTVRDITRLIVGVCVRVFVGMCVCVCVCVCVSKSALRRAAAIVSGLS